MQWTEDKNLINFLNGIMRGFRTGPGEIILIVTVILLFLAVLITIFVLQSRKKYYRRLAYAEQRFKEGLRGIRLTELEKNVLEAMTRELPGGELRKYAVVTDENAFDTAAYRLVKQKQISEEVAAALRIKLGFRKATEDEPIYSTAEIPTGKYLYIVDKYKNRCHGVLYDTVPEALYIKIAEKESQMPKGKAVRIYFRQKSGVYTFVSRIVNIHEDILTCTHSDDIDREQKRRYYREEMDKTVKIRKQGKDGEEEFEARMYDLGGGGSKIENPDCRFNRGDRIKVFIPLDNDTLPVSGKVVKTSGDKNNIHVQFSEITEAERDKIIGYLFTH